MAHVLTLVSPVLNRTVFEIPKLLYFAIHICCEFGGLQTRSVGFVLLYPHCPPLSNPAALPTQPLVCQQRISQKSHGHGDDRRAVDPHCYRGPVYPPLGLEVVLREAW